MKTNRFSRGMLRALKRPEGGAPKLMAAFPIPIGAPACSRLTPPDLEAPVRTDHAPWWLDPKPAESRRSDLKSRPSAFTLLELLMVIAIIGILAAMIGPNLGNFKPNVVAAATQQLLTDIARARQMAIGQHTTVYMVFVPPGFWNDTSFAAGLSAYPAEYSHGYALLEKQLTGYNFVSLRSIGDQPGQHQARYLSSWKTLPEGTFIPPQKFTGPPYSLYINKVGGPGLMVYTNIFGFATTGAIPFPTDASPLPPGAGRYTVLSCVAFNYLGQLVDPASGGLAASDAYIPLAKGSVAYPHDPVTHTNTPPGMPNALEVPLGNSVTNSFNVVHIDRLTGRTYVLRQEVK